MQLARSVLRFAGFALLALGAVSVALAAWLAHRSLAFSADAGRSAGRVVEYRSLPQADGRVLHTPLVEFTAGDGRRYRFAGQLSAGSPRFHIGAGVPVVYRSGDPRDARIDLFVDNWLGPLAALLVGAATLVAGTLLVGVRAGTYGDARGPRGGSTP